MAQQTDQPRTDRWNTPEMQAYRREVREATFTKEGMMVAFPTCFPGMTTAIVPDESRITSLDVTPAGVVFGGTSGYRAHLFAAGFHGIMGIVFDLGIVEDATECVAVCCGKTHFAAFVNGPGGGRAIQAPLVRMDSDLIQEWGFQRPTLKDLGQCAAGEPVVHAVADPQSNLIVGTTTKHVFRLSLTTGRIQIVGEAPAGGKLARASARGIVGRDSERTLWHFDVRTSTFRRGALQLPEGEWKQPLSWARDTQSGVLYTADGAGQLYSFDERTGFSRPLGQVPVAPVGPMAVTLDGRVFGFCGEEMARLFCLEPERKKVTPLGGAASVIERRRYGYVFGDAVTGRDGEIIFGENDNGGHLWLYFPSIQAKQAGV
ncbi:MAG: hypothetical protein EHM23_12770 [Acidobacteria bacterium]|nr:MAG: hypothetical protein EHM23_12770 [Acidobacteriota bacterium]